MMMIVITGFSSNDYFLVIIGYGSKLGTSRIRGLILNMTPKNCRPFRGLNFDNHLKFDSLGISALGCACLRQ